MDNCFEITSCEVCGNDKLTPVLNLGLHPLCDDLIPVGDDKTCQEYPIEILFCETCITAHQRFQVPKRKLFPESYHYRARFTEDVLKGMATLVDVCEQHLFSLKNKKVLDIGCNDGSLLNFFNAKDCVTIGIEPTFAYLHAKENGHAIYNNFFSIEVANAILKQYGKPDIITFTNVFAHIENLPEVINALKLLNTPQQLIVIENHYLGSVLEHSQFDTFYHEHPRSYSYTSFLHIAKNLGVDIKTVEFPSRYGGNIRVFMSGTHGKIKPLEWQEKILLDEKNYIKKFAMLNEKIDKWKINKGKFINLIKNSNEKWCGKAFPGRAAILIKMLGIDETVIEAVFEKPGSMKIGHYIPGTRIPILSDDILFANYDNQSVVNFAWHISSEIKSYLSVHGHRGKIIDILDVNDL